MLISEENRYHEGGFTHLDHDGDKLVSVSVNEFVAWDFTNGEKFCILGTAKSEQSTLRYISGLHLNCIYIFKSSEQRFMLGPKLLEIINENYYVLHLAFSHFKNMAKFEAFH